MSRWRALVLLAGLHAVDASAYDWRWPLTLEPASALAYRLELDDSVYARSRDGYLRDIEVQDAQGRPLSAALLPVLLESPAEQQWQPLHGFPLPASGGLPERPRLQALLSGAETELGWQLSVEQSGGAGSAGAARWLIDLGAEPERFSAIELQPELAAEQNWSSRPQLHGSDDLDRWRPLAVPSEIYRLRQDGHEFSVLQLPLSAPPRYLRLQLDPAPTALALRGLQRAAEAPRAAPLHWRQLEPVAGDAEHGWHYRLPGALQVGGWQVELTEPGWVAEAQLYSRPLAEAAWTPRASGVIYRLGEASMLRQSPPERLQPRREREFRLQLRPAPARPPRLRVQVAFDVIEFLPGDTPPYFLAAGSERQRRIDAPLAAMRRAAGLANADQWQPGTARLGTVEAHPQAAGSPADRRQRWLRGVLWGVLLSASLLLLLMVRQLLRKGSR